MLSVSTAVLTNKRVSLLNKLCAGWLAVVLQEVVELPEESELPVEAAREAERTLRALFPLSVGSFEVSLREGRILPDLLMLVMSGVPRQDPELVVPDVSHDAFGVTFVLAFSPSGYRKFVSGFVAGFPSVLDATGELIPQALSPPDKGRVLSTGTAISVLWESASCARCARSAKILQVGLSGGRMCSPLSPLESTLGSKSTRSSIFSGVYRLRTGACHIFRRRVLGSAGCPAVGVWRDWHPRGIEDPIENSLTSASRVTAWRTHQKVIRRLPGAACHPRKPLRRFASWSPRLASCPGELSTYPEQRTRRTGGGLARSGLAMLRGEASARESAPVGLLDRGGLAHRAMPRLPDADRLRAAKWRGS